MGRRSALLFKAKRRGQMRVGTCVDGRSVDYDESTGAFAVGGTPTSLDQIHEYLRNGRASWLTSDIAAWFDTSFPAPVGTRPTEAHPPEVASSVAPAVGSPEPATDRGRRSKAKFIGVLLALVALGIAGSVYEWAIDRGMSEPERVWRGYVDAVADNDGSEAVGHWDYSYSLREMDLSHLSAEERENAERLQWDAWEARTRAQRTLVEQGLKGNYRKWGRAEEVTFAGSYATLRFRRGEERLTVKMYRVGDEWKIIEVK